MRDKTEWSETATEFLSAMGESEDLSTVITKWLNEYRTTFLRENGIGYDYRRKRYGGQTYALHKQKRKEGRKNALCNPALPEA